MIYMQQLNNAYDKYKDSKLNQQFGVTRFTEYAKETTHWLLACSD